MLRSAILVNMMSRQVFADPCRPSRPKGNPRPWFGNQEREFVAPRGVKVETGDDKQPDACHGQAPRMSQYAASQRRRTRKCLCVKERGWSSRAATGSRRSRIETLVPLSSWRRRSVRTLPTVLGRHAAREWATAAGGDYSEGNPGQCRVEGRRVLRRVTEDTERKINTRKTEFQLFLSSLCLYLPLVLLTCFPRPLSSLL